MELSIFQIVLIISLIVIIPFGLWNQKRIKNKKMEEELYAEVKPNQNSNSNSFDESKIPSQTLEQAKTYIQSYKSQYPKESVQQGLVQIGVTNEQAKSLIDKYW